MKKWTEEVDDNSLIAYRDDDILILNKPAGVLSQSDIDGDYSIHKHFCKKHRKTYHLVNRIDRPVSGLIVMTPNPKYVQELVKKGAYIKKYLAITNKIDQQEDELIHYMKRDGKLKKAWVSNNPSDGLKEAKLSYKVAASYDNYDLVEIELQTGRFHQIRAQLADIGRHIKGDVKYGARRGNRDRSIDLHAYHISIIGKDININVKSSRSDGLWTQANAYIDGISGPI